MLYVLLVQVKQILIQQLIRRIKRVNLISNSVIQKHMHHGYLFRLEQQQRYLRSLFMVYRTVSLPALAEDFDKTNWAYTPSLDNTSPYGTLHTCK